MASSPSEHISPTTPTDTTAHRLRFGADIAPIPESRPGSSLSQDRRSSQFRLRRTRTASRDYGLATAGLEPGLDPHAEGERGRPDSNLHTACQITVVEFSEDKIEQKDFWNDGLHNFLETPRKDWVKVRWINCNGLSWDVVQLLARHYNFHSLGNLLTLFGEPRLMVY